MKNAIVSLLLLLMVTQYVTAQKKVIKIACIGNSITYGVGTQQSCERQLSRCAGADAGRRL